MSTLTGYEPRRDYGSRWNRFLFNGEKERYEIWETRFFGHLQSLDLKDAILGANLTGDNEDNERNEEAYADLIILRWQNLVINNKRNCR